MRTLIVLALLMAVGQSALLAQEDDVRLESLVALMPDVDGLPGFTLMLEPEVYAPGNLSDHINGEVEAFHPYGVGNTVTAILARDNTRVVVDIFDMTSPLGAYGVYSTHRPPQPDRAGIGADSFIDDISLVFFDGDYYVDLTVMGRRDDAREVLTLIAEEIDRRIDAGDAIRPAALDLFPEEGQAEDTDQYLPRGHLGIEFVPLAFVIEYDVDGTKLRASISQFESKEASLEAYDALKAYVEEKAEDVASDHIDGAPLITGNLKYRGVLAATVRGEQLLTVCGGDTNEPALSLLARLMESARAR